jgi:hypothetical protein
VLAGSFDQLLCLFFNNPTSAHGTWKCFVEWECQCAGQVTQSVEGYWQGLNGKWLPNHSQGLKYVIDEAHAHIYGKSAGTTPAPQSALIFEMSPAKLPPSTMNNYIEGIPHDYAPIKEVYESYQLVLANFKGKPAVAVLL